jgi:hypothetical protein
MSTIDEIELEIKEIKELNKDWKTDRDDKDLITSLTNKQNLLRSQQGKSRPTF